jgi:hypothetical protein
MKRTILAICITGFIIAAGAIGIGNCVKAIKAAETAQLEGITTIEPTDSGLASLDALAGGDVMSLFPRNFKLAQATMTLVRVKRSRFVEANRSVNSALLRGERSELRWYDLTAVPIETRLIAAKRPMITVLTKGGSVIRNGRLMKVDDVKLVVIFDEKNVKFIELI